MRNGLSAAADSQQHKCVVCRNSRAVGRGRERLAVSGRVKIKGVEVTGSVGLETRPECNANCLVIFLIFFFLSEKADITGKFQHWQVSRNSFQHY